MTAVIAPHLLLAAGAGVVGGLALLAKGLSGYRRAGRVDGIASSTATSLAAGEVRLSGTVLPGPVLLVSPLQSVQCVYYSALTTEQQHDGNVPVFKEQRSVGFSVRDATGEVRVVPRGASWFVPPAFRERTGLMGDEPAGLQLRDAGWAMAPAYDHDAAVASLLTVRPAMHGLEDSGAFGGGALASFATARRSYQEARVEPGQQVTVFGYAQDWASIRDEIDLAAVAVGDPEVAADLAQAQADGTLAPDPAHAWGNAAIPGFGIGRPSEPPTLDDGATPLPLADPATAERAERAFDLDADELVVASGPGVPLEIHAGTSQDAAETRRGQLMLGLAGGLVSIACALALGLMLTGALS